MNAWSVAMQEMVNGRPVEETLKELAEASEREFNKFISSLVSYEGVDIRLKLYF